MKRGHFIITACFLAVQLLHVTCSEFNEPVKPVVFFTREAVDYITGTTIRMSTGSISASIEYGWDLHDYFGMVNARLFIRERNEDEMSCNDLSKGPVMCKVDIYQKQQIYHDSQTVQIANVSCYDKDGNRLYAKTHVSSVRKLVIDIPDNIIYRVPVYFWQLECYVGGDTIRLPRRPGIWNCRK